MQGMIQSGSVAGKARSHRGRSPLHRARRSDAGFAMGMVLLILVLLTVMGLALGFVGATNLTQMQHTTRQVGLLHSANGGVHELMDTLYGNSAYGLAGNEAATGLYSSTGGVTRYSWTFDPSSGKPYCTNNLDGLTAVTGHGGREVPAGCALLFVTAETESPTGDLDRATVAALATNRYPYAIASDGIVNVADVSSLVEGQGHIRSNLVGGSPNIEAQVVDGMTFSRDGAGSIEVEEGSGPENYDQPPTPLPDIPIAEILASWSAAGVGGAHPWGGPAMYQFDNTVVATTDDAGHLDIGTTHIEPPATLYVEGHFLVNGGAEVAKGIHIFCTGNFRVNGSLVQVALDPARRSLAARGKDDNNGNGNDHKPSPTVTPSPTATVEPSPSPVATSSPSPSPSPSPVGIPSPSPSPAGPAVSPSTNFVVSGDEIRFNGGSAQSINLLAMNGIRQNGASNLHGFFYVRNGDFDLNGSHLVTGVIITRSGSVQGDVKAGNANVVYDPHALWALSGLELKIKGTMRAMSWWVEQ